MSVGARLIFPNVISHLISWFSAVHYSIFIRALYLGMNDNIHVIQLGKQCSEISGSVVYNANVLG